MGVESAGKRGSAARVGLGKRAGRGRNPVRRGRVRFVGGNRIGPGVLSGAGESEGVDAGPGGRSRDRQCVCAAEHRGSNALGEVRAVHSLERVRNRAAVGETPPFRRGFSVEPRGSCDVDSNTSGARCSGSFLRFLRFPAGN